MIGLGLKIQVNPSINDNGLDGTSFITTWRTTTANETITIPTTAGGYNYDVITSDGQTFTGVTGSQAITFATAGDYDVSISGTFPRIYFNNGGDRTKIVDIKQWGNISWTDMSRAFYGCNQLQATVTDTPDLTNVTNMISMLRSSSFNKDINHWDVSNVTNINFMFYGAGSFNQPLNNWDVSNVTDMIFVLRGTSFNQDLSNWDVSGLTETRDMFHDTPFTGTGVENWDVSNVTNFSRMFDNSSFNKDISFWDITNGSNFNDFLRINTTLSTANYDAILIGWNATLQATYPNGSGYTPSIGIDFGNSEYTGGGAAEAARTSLINNFNWTITDGGIA